MKSGCWARYSNKLDMEHFLGHPVSAGKFIYVITILKQIEYWPFRHCTILKIEMHLSWFHKYWLKDIWMIKYLEVQNFITIKINNWILYNRISRYEDIIFAISHRLQHRVVYARAVAVATSKFFFCIFEFFSCLFSFQYFIFYF